jgi:DNA-binding XRE family transcriptional regulator
MERAADRERPSGPRIPLKTLRISAGLTRDELAMRVGLSKSAFAGIENGHHAPGLEVAMRIANVLGADVADLFDFHECACGCGELTAKRFVSGHNCRQPEHGSFVARGHRERRRRLGIPEEKVCERCGVTFTRSQWPNVSDNQWVTRRFCSKKCQVPVPVEERFCGYWKCWKLFKPDYNAPGVGMFCSKRCAQLNRWDELVRDGKDLVADEFIRAMRGQSRHYFGRKSVLKRTKTRRSYTDEQVDEVLRLAAGGYGHDTIAEITGLHRDTVRRIRRPERRS